MVLIKKWIAVIPEILIDFACCESSFTRPMRGGFRAKVGKLMQNVSFVNR